MQPLTPNDNVARVTRSMKWMIIGLAVLVAGISLVAFYMSFAVLRDLAVRSALPEPVAWGLPVIIDGSIVAAILVILAWRLCGKRVVWPWVVLGVFSAVSIVGNGAHTAIAHDAAQGVPLWLAVTFGALPPIGLMSTCELLVRLPKAADVANAVAASQPGVAPEESHEQAAPSSPDSAPAPEPAEQLEPVPEPAPEPVVAPSPLTPTPAEPASVAIDMPTVPVVDAVAPEHDVADAEPAVADSVAPVDDFVADLDDSADQPSAPVTPLRPGLPDLATKAERIDWLVEQKQAGVEVPTKDLAEHFGVSERSIQRYLTEVDDKLRESSSAELEKVS